MRYTGITLLLRNFGQKLPIAVVRIWTKKNKTFFGQKFPIEVVRIWTKKNFKNVGQKFPIEVVRIWTWITTELF